MITVYGIKTCDTCKKALKWIETATADYRFHDFRKDGLSEETLKAWLDRIDRDILVNRRGTTYRNLGAIEKQDLAGPSPEALILNQPTLLKRPIFAKDGKYVVGFKEAEKAAVLDLLK